MYDATQYENQLAELDEQRQSLKKEWNRKHKQLSDIKYNSAEYLTVRSQLAEIEEQLSTIRREKTMVYDEWATYRTWYNNERYERPDNGIAKLLNKLLGPLPDRACRIHAEAEDLRETKRSVLLALMLVVAAIAALLTLVYFFPVLRVSPFSLMLDVFSGWLSPYVGVTASLIVGIVMTIVSSLVFVWFLSPSHKVRHKGKFIDRAAMAEEQWFRMGAESWSLWRRAGSCIAFGATHVVNMIYPIASLLVVGALGAIFMAVYIREYRQSGSVRKATLAATRLHATYNRFALWYMLVAILVSFVWVMLPLFL